MGFREYLAEANWSKLVDKFMDWLVTQNLGDMNYSRTGNYNKDFETWLISKNVRLSGPDMEAALEKIHSF